MSPSERRLLCIFTNSSPFLGLHSVSLWCPETTCALATVKMWDHERALPEGVLVDSHVLNSSVNSKWHTLPTEQGLGDRQKFVVFYGFKWGFPGLLVSTESRKAQNFRRELCYIFCAFSDAFWSHVFLKSTCTDFDRAQVQVVLKRPCGHWWIHTSAQPLVLMFV